MQRNRDADRHAHTHRHMCTNSVKLTWKSELAEMKPGGVVASWKNE